MDGRQRSKQTLERGRRLGTGVWVSYLTTGAVLAVTRVALFVWLVHRARLDTATQTDSFLVRWLYPEAVVSLLWNSLVSSDWGTAYYLVWGSLFTVGSFALATPLLFVGWLRQRNLIVQIALCGLTAIAVSVLLVVIVRLSGF